MATARTNIMIHVCIKVQEIHESQFSSDAQFMKLETDERPQYAEIFQCTIYMVAKNNTLLFYLNTLTWFLP